MSTNVPPVQILPTGPVIPQQSAVLAGVLADYNQAFNATVNPDKRTPQGQLASSTSAIVADGQAMWAWLINQIDPDNAADFMQDAIGRIYFMDRTPGTPTVVQCLCIGAFNVTIPAGAKVRDTNGNVYVCTQAGTIGISGNITLPFACIVLGPTACPANTVTTILSGPNGWDTVNNPLAGAVGSNVESRAEFEFRRKQTVAIGAKGSIQAIAASVWDVAGVIDVYAVENFTDNTINTGVTAYPVVAHSFYLAVVGGAAVDIGNAIFSKKNDGSNMNGNTSVVITDDSYDIPKPAYTYSWNTPTNTAFKFAVQVQNSAALPSDIIQQVQNAVVASFTGADGSGRVRTGSTVLAGKFYAPISAIGQEVNVISVLLNIAPGAATLTNVTLGIDQFPTLQASDVVVTLV